MFGVGSDEQAVMGQSEDIEDLRDAQFRLSVILDA